MPRISGHSRPELLPDPSAASCKTEGPEELTAKGNSSFSSRQSTSRAVGGACLSTILAASSLICFNFFPETQNSLERELTCIPKNSIS